MFLGWYDPDKKYPTWKKLADAVARYEEKFGESPVSCLTSPEDAQILRGDPQVQRYNLTIVGAPYVPRHTFYVGIEDIVMAEGEIPATPAAVAA